MAGEASVALAPSAVARARLGEKLGGAAPFLVGGLVTGILTADEGGYWPTAWGWTSLALAWLGLIGLVLRAGRISRLELAFAGLLAAFVGWTGLSTLWTSSTTQTALKTEQALVYVLAAIAVVAVARAASYRGLVWGVWAGSTSACLYGLVTRLAPERLRLPTRRPAAASRRRSATGTASACSRPSPCCSRSASRPTDGHSSGARPRPPRCRCSCRRSTSPSAAAPGSRSGSRSSPRLRSPRRLALLATALVQAAPAASPSGSSSGRAAMHRRPPPSPRRSTPAIACSGSCRCRPGCRGARRRAGLLAGRWRPPALAPARFAGRDRGRRGRGGRRARRALRRPGREIPARAALDRGRRAGRQTSTTGSSRSRATAACQWHVALDEWHAHRCSAAAPAPGPSTGPQPARTSPSSSTSTTSTSRRSPSSGRLGSPFSPWRCWYHWPPPFVPPARARPDRRRRLRRLRHAAYDWDWELPGVTIAALFCAGAMLAAGREMIRRPAGPRPGCLVVAAIAGALAFFGLLGNRALVRSGDAFGKAISPPHSAARARGGRPGRRSRGRSWPRFASPRATGRRCAAYRQAVAKDPRDWQLWLGLAAIARGPNARARWPRHMLSPGVRSP